MTEIYENDQAYQVDLYENWENTPDNWQYSGPYVASNNNDVIYGTRWDDTIIGGEADQDIHIIGGENFIDGKGGTDTVHINGDSSDFSLSRLFDEVKVTSGSTSQTLEAIEFVSFNDQTIELSELPAALSTPFDADEATENKVRECRYWHLHWYYGVNATAADPADYKLDLLDDAAGRFALNSDGQIVTASSIDFEIAESHEVTVEAHEQKAI